MLTTKWMFPDRTAVGKATYNVRNLLKNIDKMDIPAEVKEEAVKRVKAFESFLKHSTYDEDALGNVVHVCNG